MPARTQTLNPKEQLRAAAATDNLLKRFNDATVIIRWNDKEEDITGCNATIEIQDRSGLDQLVRDMEELGFRPDSIGGYINGGADHRVNAGDFWVEGSRPVRKDEFHEYRDGKLIAFSPDATETGRYHQISSLENNQFPARIVLGEGIVTKYLELKGLLKQHEVQATGWRGRA